MNGAGSTRPAAAQATVAGRAPAAVPRFSDRLPGQAPENLP